MPWNRKENEQQKEARLENGPHGWVALQLALRRCSRLSLRRDGGVVVIYRVACGEAGMRGGGKCFRVMDGGNLAHVCKIQNSEIRLEGSDQLSLGLKC